MNKEIREGLDYLLEKIINFVGAKQAVKKEECEHSYDVYIKGEMPLRFICKKCHKIIFSYESIK